MKRRGTRLLVVVTLAALIGIYFGMIVYSSMEGPGFMADTPSRQH